MFATTIPAVSAIRLPLCRVRANSDQPSSRTAWAFPGVSGLCLLSAVSPAVHHCFCCRAAAIRPRVTSRLAMFLLLPDYQAARAKSALLALLLNPV